MTLRMIRRLVIRKQTLLALLIALVVAVYKLISYLELPVNNLDLRETTRNRPTFSTTKPSLIGTSHDTSISSSASGLNRTYQYCNSPFEPISGTEGASPNGYKLRMLHVFTRHGDRGSLYFLPKYPRPKLDCNFKTWYSRVGNDEKFKDFYRITIKSLSSKIAIDSAFKKFSLYPIKDVCGTGELTNLGVLQHLKLGQYLYNRYRDHFHVLPWDRTNFKIRVRSSVADRTFKSAIALLYGFLPDFKETAFTVNASVSLFMCLPAVHQCGCRLTKTINQRYHEYFHSNFSQHLRPEHEEEFRKICDMAGVKRDVTSVGHLLDAVLPTHCHRQETPCSRETPEQCIDGRTLDQLWKIHAIQESLKNQDPDRNFLRSSFLVLYPVLNEIAHSATQILNDKDKRTPVFMLYSGHDKTLSALRSVLGTLDEIWPPYASRVVFEIYESISVKGKLYMRILYNGKDVTNTVIFCSSSDTENLCEFKLFQNFVAAQLIDLFGNHDYSSVCES